MTTAHQPITGASLIAQERESQIKLGYTAEHDHGHDESQLTAAAICYAIASDPPQLDPAGDAVLYQWPWDLDRFNASSDDILNLARAGALLAAEIDRRLALGARTTAAAS